MSDNRNPGALLISSVRSALDVIPLEFRASLRRTSQKVNLDVVPDPLSFTMISSAVIQDVLNERRKENWTLDGSVFPTLVEYVHVKEADAIATISRTIVDPTLIGTTYPAAQVDAVNRLVIEYRPLDAKHSLQIISQLGATPATQVLYGVANYDLPPVLTYAAFVRMGTWAYNSAGGGAMDIAFDVAMDLDIKRLRGPFSSRLTRTYSQAVPGEITVTVFRPLTESVWYKFGGYFQSSRMVRAIAQVIMFNLPETLHAGGVIPVSVDTVDNGSTPSGLVALKADLTATVPTDLPYGTWITIDGTTRKWEFGLWVQDKLEIFIPVA